MIQISATFEILGMKVSRFLNIDGALYQFDLVYQQKYHFKPLNDSKRPIKLTAAEFLRKLTAREITQVSENEIAKLFGINLAERVPFPVGEKSQAKLGADEYAKNFSERQIGIARWRKYFVDAFNKTLDGDNSRENRARQIKAAFEEARKDPEVPADLIRRENLPSIQSVYRWCQMWHVEKALLSLIPATNRCGRKPQDLDPRYAEVIEGTIDWYIKYGNTTRRGAIAKALSEIQDLRERYSELKLVKPPSPSQIYKAFRELNNETHQALEQGRITAHRAHAPVLGSIKTTRPLERVEIDSTRLDIIPKAHGSNIILPRPWLTVMIDAHTRMIVAFIVTQTHPSSADICRLIRTAIQPKDPTRLSEMGVESPWLACGAILQLIMDNGKEFISAAVRSACHAIGIEIVNLPAHSPNFKGRVERIFGTLNSLGIHELPGTTKSNPKQRGERNPDAENLLTVSQIEEKITKIICDIYHRRVHRKLGCSPLEAWTREAAKHPPRLIDDEQRLRLLTSVKTERSLTRSGIQIESIQYNSLALNQIFRMLGRNKKVLVTYDSFDLSQIEVTHPTKNTTLIVPCIDAQYHGVDLRTHQLIRSTAAALNRKDDRKIYLRARAELAAQSALLAGPRAKRMRPKHNRAPSPHVSGAGCNNQDIRKRAPPKNQKTRKQDVDRGPIVPEESILDDRPEEDLVPAFPEFLILKSR